MEIADPTQKEALINELKGNLFEYLVGQSLALKKGISPQFYKNFGGQIKNQLVEYENWLRGNDPLLFKKLPVLAEALSKELMPHLPGTPDNLLVIGKSGGHRHSLYETDLLVIEGERQFPISVKLCKTKAFVNTKSGGVKSFLIKYFNCFDKAPIWQAKLNETLKLSFNNMGHELYALEGMDFKGGFDDRWIHSHLPGKVPAEMKPKILKFYSEVIGKIYEIFLEMYALSPEKLKTCLYPIMGFGSKEIIQATCFHGTEDGQKYHLKGIKIFTGSSLEHNLKDFNIEKIKANLSSFEIKAGELTLQIRVKPMNIFTTPAVKINCSVKENI